MSNILSDKDKMQEVETLHTEAMDLCEDVFFQLRALRDKLQTAYDKEYKAAGMVDVEPSRTIMLQSAAAIASNIDSINSIITPEK